MALRNRPCQSAIVCRCAALEPSGRATAVFKVGRWVPTDLSLPSIRETAVQTAYQEFEHGSMLWISRTTYMQERLIYVFFDDGTFQQFDDTWHDGDPPNGNMSPPPRPDRATARFR